MLFGVFRHTLIYFFSLIWRRRHCRWRTANFDLSPALMDIEQWESFSVPQILWHGASVYNAEHLAVELPIPVLTTEVCRGRDMNPQLSELYLMCTCTQFFSSGKGARSRSSYAQFLHNCHSNPLQIAARGIQCLLLIQEMYITHLFYALIWIQIAKNCCYSQIHNAMFNLKLDLYAKSVKSRITLHRFL